MRTLLARLVLKTDERSCGSIEDRRGRCRAAVGDIGAPAAVQRLWFSCKPLGYRQGRLEMRRNQPQDRMPPLRAPILTKMVVSASMASVLMRCCSSHNRSTGGLLIRTTCMRRVHHMRGGADDVTGLLIAALTASTHANRLWQRSEVLLSLPCDSSRSCCW